MYHVPVGVHSAFFSLIENKPACSFCRKLRKLRPRVEASCLRVAGPCARREKGETYSFVALVLKLVENTIFCGPLKVQISDPTPDSQTQ